VASSADGATGSITVTTRADCTWTAKSSDGWVSLALSAGVGTSTIVYTIAPNTGSARTATLTVVGSAVPVSQDAAAPPAISAVSPASAVAGAQVTIVGARFGSAQGTGSVWLGTRTASVVSWTDTAIVATVSAGSQPGTAQVRRADAQSNELPFTVVTPLISSVTPDSGPSGTLVSISGSGFGSGQGTGGVWLAGTALNATAWSDTRVQVTVPAAALSGSISVLQGGVMSNAVPFTVTGAPPHIDGIWPLSGSPGTTVYIMGQGFGATQGSGSVLLGGADAPVVSWSDGWVQITVGSSAISGAVKLQQNATWSNSKSFVVTSANGSTLTLSPNLFNLVVGESRSIQALDGTGAAVSGLTWSSSDTAVVTVSNDPSPLIAAVAPGTATVRAGDAAAEVTVFAEGAMPEGTVLWSVPGPLSGVSDIKVAVPVPGSNIDVFAIGNQGEVQAIGADGKVAWTVAAPIPSYYESRPDFQGGLVAYPVGSDHTIVRLEPSTGHATTLYGNANEETQNFVAVIPAIHPDGVVMTVDYTCHDFCNGADPDDSAAVVGIDIATGARKFRVPLVPWTFTDTNADSAFCVGDASQDGANVVTHYHAWPNNQLTIAADGFAYLSYFTFDAIGTRHRSANQPYPDEATVLFEQMGNYRLAQDWANALATLDALLAAIDDSNNSQGHLLRTDYQYLLQYGYNSQTYSLAFAHETAWAPQFKRACDTTESTVTKMHLMRVGANGQSSDVVVKEWPSTDQITNTYDGGGWTGVELHSGPSDIRISEYTITNADEGALFSWQAALQCYESGTFGDRTFTQLDPCPNVPENHLTVSNNGVASDVLWSVAGPTGSAAEPMLQLSDDSFAASTAQGLTVFDAQGQIRWTVPAGTPAIATSGGGLVTSDGLELDSNGSAMALRRLYTQSWLSNLYQLGSIEQVSSPPVILAASFAQVAGAGPMTFANADLAAYAALNTIWEHASFVGWEFGGRVCQNQSNRYYFAEAITDRDAGRVDVLHHRDAPCRTGHTLIGVYHTHPFATGEPYPSGTVMGVGTPNDIYTADQNPTLVYYLMSRPLRPGGIAVCPQGGCVATNEKVPARSFYRWQGSTTIPNNAINNLWLKLPAKSGDPFGNGGWVRFPRQ
jgi:hypothetical protein